MTVSLPPLPRTRSERILWSVLEEHFEDAQYLFLRWEGALDGPDDSLHQLAVGPERRFAAHVRGLVHGGLPVVERILFPAIRADGAEEAFDERAQRATAALGILTQPVSGTERLITAASEELVAGSAVHLHRALQLWDAPHSDRALWEASLRTDPKSWPAWLRTFAIRGQPADENMVNYCLRGDQDSVLAALEVVPDMAASAGDKIHDVLGYFLSSKDAPVRVAALRAGLQVGSHRAWNLCREWFQSPAVPDGVIELIGIVGNAKDHQALIQSVADGHISEGRVWALGHSGRPYAAHLCAQLLRHADERIVRLAFEAFCAITGLPSDNPEVAAAELRPGDRDLAEPDGAFAAAEAARDEAVESDAAAGLDPLVRRLPMPKPEAVEAWWAQVKDRFDPRCRYLYGRPSDLAWMRRAYIHGPSRRRHLLGYEITLRTRSRVQPSTRAFAARQYRQLAELADLRLDPQRGYLDI
ncbi:hypothetical protein ENSA5_34200 [Enhygromyxa salina]|uniref:TIGR02270 family protein n=1 Tax=Enhygromyxa salina TaxID=215803 RepID=A0A2S9XX28_9BACT|nr:hypothetical protein [Enhygromyxa salina]PRP97428.1 hypothetical protein ENSA5_34200 [Enhygromyxa salina]